MNNVLIDMEYNLGPTTFRKFHNFIAAVKDQSWQAAGGLAKNSTWCGQVGSRCVRDVGLIEKGCQVVVTRKKYLEILE